MWFLSVVFVIGTVAWVFCDVRSRDWSRTSYRRWGPAWWGAMTFLLWIVFFPWYLAIRSTAPRKRDGDAAAVARLKRCPDCAGMVDGAARTCRFCRYRFVGRPRWGRAIAITLAMLVGMMTASAYAEGSLDAPLSHVGLNTRDCITMPVGNVCGDDAVAMCSRFYDEEINGKTCRAILDDAGEPIPARS